AGALVQLGLVPPKAADHAWRREHIEAGLALWRELDDLPGLAEALFYRGYTAWLCMDNGVAQACWEEAWAIYSALGSLNEVSEIRRYQIDLARLSGELETAKTLCEEELARWRASGDALKMACTLERQGYILWCEGDLNHARTVLEESLLLYQQAR